MFLKYLDLYMYQGQFSYIFMLYKKNLRRQHTLNRRKLFEAMVSVNFKTRFD